MVRPLVVLVLFSALVPHRSIAQSSALAPAISGYITHVSSASDFDVNGLHVICTSSTQTFQGSTDLAVPRISGGEAFFGERVELYGKIDRKKHEIEATKIVFRKFKPEVFSGLAVIDRILSSPTSGELIVRADGYRISINSSTQVDYTGPISSLAEVKPNVWITYHGTLRDGAIMADRATFQPNDVSNREGNLLKKTEYDPSKVPDDSKQTVWSKQFLGLNPKKIPPYRDTVMQARVDRIGSSLIPEYQRKLANDDPSKIAFRFQLIDNPKFHDALTLPNGIILIPRQIVERLPEDAQLAAVLADNIACALEKQTYRLAPSYAAMSGAQIASDVGGFFVPGLGLATGVANYASAKSIRTDLLDQSGRVSLCLLRDAGYDLEQAPVAWWRLAAKPSKSLAETRVPPRAENLYRTIYLIWRNDLSMAPSQTSTN